MLFNSELLYLNLNYDSDYVFVAVLWEESVKIMHDVNYRKSENNLTVPCGGQA